MYLLGNSDLNFKIVKKIINLLIQHALATTWHKRNKHNSFSIFHLNIFSLPGNFLKMEEVLHNLDYKSNLLALTETWRTNKNLLTPGTLSGYE